MQYCLHLITRPIFQKPEPSHYGVYVCLRLVLFRVAKLRDALLCVARKKLRARQREVDAVPDCPCAELVLSGHSSASSLSASFLWYGLNTCSGHENDWHSRIVSRNPGSRCVGVQPTHSANLALSAMLRV